MCKKYPSYSNCVGSDNMVLLFANKFNTLCNSVCNEYYEMSNLRIDIRYDIDSDSESILNGTINAN